MDEVNTLIRSLDREIWLVTARKANRLGGLISTSVTSQSIVPQMPRIGVSIDRSSHTWELIETSQAFALHLLGPENLDWVWHFGLQSGWNQDKFQGLTYREAKSGSPILEGSLGWLDCRVETEMDLGDRTLFVGEVMDGVHAKNAPPLMGLHLMQLAPPEIELELKKQRARNSDVCSVLIQQWRNCHRSDGLNHP